jgi:hypothetical protein
LSVDIKDSGKRSSQFEADLVALVSIEDLQISEDKTFENIGLIYEEFVLRILEPTKDVFFYFL